MIAAPFDTYPLNDDELADELQNIDATYPPIKLQGPVTIITGMRRNPLGDGPDLPVVLAQGADGLHLLALPDTEAA